MHSSGEELAGRTLSWRALALGSIGAIGIAVLTPLNNFVLNNTDLVSTHFPTVVVMLLLAMVLGNAVWMALRGKLFLQRGEMILVLSMWLIASAFPAVGMMRYLPGHLTALWQLSGESPRYAQQMDDLHLPAWLWPTMEDTAAADRARAEVVTGFYNRTVADRSTFAGQLRAVPWRAWIVPMVAWGVMMLALCGAVVSMLHVMMRQWMDVERLQFPIAGVYQALIEPPAPGRWMNDLFRNPSMWVAAGAVFVLHSINGLHLYLPKQIPEIPTGFDLQPYTTDNILQYTDWQFRSAKVFFTFVGMAFFVRQRTAFSLWFCYLMLQVYRMFVGQATGELVTERALMDQVLGAAGMLAIFVIYLARRHLWGVMSSIAPTLRRRASASERLALIAFVLCVVVMMVWLMLAGATFIGAAVIVIVLLGTLLLVARVVSETGVLFTLIPVDVRRPWILLWGGLGARTSGESFLLGGMFSGIVLHDTRQTLAGYAGTVERLNRPTPRAFGVIGVLLLTGVVSYFASFGSTLFTRYNYDLTLDQQPKVLDDNWGTLLMPRIHAIDPLIDYQTAEQPVRESHSAAAHVSFGAAAIGVLSVLRARFSGWPIEPVGYLLCPTWGMSKAWLSIFLGWAIKQLCMSVGGKPLVDRCKPAFIGLIVGSCTAVGFWLLVAAVRAMLGLEFLPHRILP
jgi:hypothetical protein